MWTFLVCWLHTVLSSSFCENLDIIPAHRHHRYNIAFTHSFDSVRNNTLDHFILSGMLHENCIRAVTVLLHLSLETEYISLSCEARTPRATWQKPMQMSNYCSVLRENLASVNLPTDVLMCHDVNCCDDSHYAALGHYVADITCACSDACKPKHRFLLVRLYILGPTSNSAIHLLTCSGWNCFLTSIRTCTCNVCNIMTSAA